ncbi:hypothetical protein J2X04_001368 [Lysobacter niabensis]|uniref:Uncharacterized protein n=1 Tax=Agrilutibacter niabensis TaxID=380628 RepID=A0ABU1VNF8_9GAMM|nr:hypothetical protein [Lysobacter niabensis]MDR7099021.1 hypothetical protein [Lysobacter niabensis]
MEQLAEADPKTPLGAWQASFTVRRAPALYSLRADPFENGPNSFYYGDWVARRMFVLVPAQAIVGKVLETFKEFPPRAKAASFTIGDALDKIMTASPSQN